MSHTHIIGQPGTGKTALAKAQAIQHMQAGAAVVFIDPFGTDVDDVMAHTPSARLKDTVLFDPTDSPLISWNPLSETTNTPLLASFITDSFRGAFRIDIIPPNILAVLKSLIYTGVQFDLTLFQLMFAFHRPLFETADIPNPILRQFWEDYYKKTDKDKDAVSWSTYTKLYDLLLDPTMQQLFKTHKGHFHMSDVVNDKLLFVSLPLSELGQEKVSLLGSLCLSLLYLAAVHRDTTKPLYLYIDHVDLFAPMVVAQMLNVLGRYNVHITAIHQTIDQLDRTTFAALRGSCDTKIAFKTSAEDSDILIPNPINRDWRLDNLKPYTYRYLPWYPARREHATTLLPEPTAKNMVERIRTHTHRHYC